jgi:hypothetical protein
MSQFRKIHKKKAMNKFIIPGHHTLQSMQTPLTSQIPRLQNPCTLNTIIKKHKNKKPRDKADRNI